MSDTRTCANCSHLRTEHRSGVTITICRVTRRLRAWCCCCDCPEFVPEPDDEVLQCH